MADETRIVKIEIEAEDNFKKLADIKAAIIDNKNQQASLKQAFKEGSITLKEFSEEIVRNEANVKKQSSQYNELQKQVTGVKSPFDKLGESINNLKGNFNAATPALDKVTGGAASAAEGIMGMVKSSLAFIATPIGAVIGAIGLAIGSLIAYFKSSEEGQNRLNKITLIFKTILEQLKNIVEDAGEAIYNAFTNPKQALIDFGNFLQGQIINRFVGFFELIPKLGDAVKLLFEGKWSEAATVAGDAVGKVVLGVENATNLFVEFGNKVAESFNGAVADGKRLAELQKQLDSTERQLIVQRATTDRDVAKLREEALTQESSKRKETITQAINLIQALSDAEVLQKQRLLEKAQLELKANGDDKEAKLKVAEATAAVIEAEAQRYTEAFKLRKQFEILDKNEEQDRLKKEQDKKKEANELQKQRLAADKAEWDEKVANAKAANEAIDQKAQEDFNREQVRQKAKKELSNTTYSALSTALTTFAGKSKSTQVGLAVADAGLAITRIFSAPAVPFIEPFATITRIIQAGIVGAKTAGAISQMNAAAGGGSFLTSGPTTLLVGDNPGGVERIDVTPISGKGKTTINPFSGMIALAGGGTVISDGGYSTNQGTSLTDQSLLIADIIKNMPTPVSSWKEFTQLDRRIKAKESATSR